MGPVGHVISKASDKSLLRETWLIKGKCGEKAGEDAYGSISRLLK